MRLTKDNYLMPIKQLTCSKRLLVRAIAALTLP